MACAKNSALRGLLRGILIVNISPAPVDNARKGLLVSLNLKNYSFVFGQSFNLDALFLRASADQVLLEVFPMLFAPDDHRV